MLDVTGEQFEIGLTNEEVEEIYNATGDRVTEVKFDAREEQAGDRSDDREAVEWSVKA